MPRAKATDGLSEAARAEITRGLAEGWTAERIAQAVLDTTGEKVAERTVSRRMAEWQAEAARRKLGRERMQDFVAACQERGIDPASYYQALVMDVMEQNPEALSGADPIKLHGLGLAAQETALKARALDIKERAIAIDEKKLALLEAKEERTLAALTKSTGTKTPEDRLREIEEIYGITG
jgi:hypothetical protein